MAKKWSVDSALVESVAANLVELLPLFPKRLIRLDALVREHEMPFSHIQILVLLAEGAMAIGTLSDKLSIAKPNITPLVDSLREQHYVERVRDARDRRIVNVCITDSGLEKLQAIQRSVAKQVAEWPGLFSRSEVKAFKGALSGVIRMAMEVGAGE